jgi:hypothetical protein
MGEAQQDAVITVMETPIQVNAQDALEHSTLIAEHSLWKQQWRKLIIMQ